MSAARQFEGPLSAALKVAAAGLPVFPCNPDTKAPLTKRGFHDASTDPGQIERWWLANPEALIGVPTGEPSGLVVIDLDPAKEGSEADTWHETHKTQLGAPRIHHTRREGGRHLVYKMPDADVRCSTSKLAPGIDVRANGGYVIWWPAHGCPYQGVSSKRAPVLPDWLTAALARPVPSYEDMGSPIRLGSLEIAKPLLQGAFDPSDYDDWIETGMAIHSASGGAEWGLDLWDQWSQTCPEKYAGREDLRYRWERFKDKPGGLTGQYLRMHTVAEPSDFDDLTEGTEKEKERRFRPIPGEEFINRPPLEWLVDGVLPKATVGMVYGLPAAGKTFWAIDMAAAVARGAAWNGRKVKQGNVVFVAAEDPYGVSARMRAYKQDRGSVPLHVIEDAPRLATAQDVTALTAAIRPLNPALVVIDTLSCTMAGSDENSSEMGLAFDSVKRINKETGAMVLLLHHPGKESSRGPRGWSGMVGHLDVSFELEADNQYREVVVRKMKNGPGGGRFAFELRTVGESCVVEHVVPRARVKNGSAEPRNEYEERIADILDEQGGSMPEGDLRDALVDAFSDDKEPETVERAWRRARKKMRDDPTWCLIEDGVVSLRFSELGQEPDK